MLAAGTWLGLVCGAGAAAYAGAAEPPDEIAPLPGEPPAGGMLEDTAVEPITELPPEETPPEEPALPKISAVPPCDLKIRYYPEYHGGVRLSFWLYPPRISGRPQETDDEINFRDFDDGWTVSLTAFFEVQTPTDKIFTAELWSMSSTSSGTMSGNVQWGGGSFSSGEDVVAASRMKFYGLSYGNVFLQRDNFEFGIYLGGDFADVDLSIASTATTEYGSLSRLIPTLTVGFNLWFYPHEEWGIYSRMTGLSWTDILGFEGGVFNPSGDYQLIEVGAVWRPAPKATALAGYRRFLMRYNLTEETLTVDLSGVFIGVCIRW